MKLKKLYLRVFALLIATISFGAIQAQTVSGTVTDKDGSPVAGVSVVVKNAKTGTSTDSQGKFTLKAAAGTSLVFSSVGYNTEEVTVVDKTDLKVVLQPGANASLNEVVVVGYGTARKRDLTGAVTKLSSQNFNQGAIVNGAEALQGKVAGVVVTPVGGDPNGNSEIRIRGLGSIQGDARPLIVVDGVQGVELSTIPPSEIESFDILKDASATAIYGSRGANGVVLITTKKGRSGASKVDYSAFIASESVAHTVELLGADAARAYFKANNPLLDGGTNTDWIKATTQTGLTHSNNLAISGGTDKFNYRSSIGYFKKEGVLLNTSRENINLRLSAQQKALNNKLDLQYNINYNIVNSSLVDYGSDPANVTISGAGQESLNPFLFAYTMNPTNPVYDKSATNVYGGFFQPNGYASQNPVAFLKQIYNRARTSNMFGSVRAEYSLMPDLKVFVFSSLNNIGTVNDYHSPTTAFNTPTGYAAKGNSNTSNYLGNTGLNYRKKWGEHNFDATLVYEYYKSVNDNFKIAVRDLKYDNVLNNNLSLAGTVVQGYPQSYKDDYTLISYLTRFNYNYAGKYFLTASVRRDGSSKLGANNQWGTFPSVSGAWAVSKENFMNSTKTWLSDLRLRVGYGITGNQNGITPNLSKFLVGFGSPTLSNGNVITPTIVTQNANPDLRWEQKQQLNAGIDFSILKGKITGSLDFYSGTTKDLLYDFPLEASIAANKFNGVTHIVANAGELSNKGVEITVNSPVVKGKDFQLNVGYNMSFNTNKVVNLDGVVTAKDGSKVTLEFDKNGVNWGTIYGRGLSFSNITKLAIGQPLGVIYVPHYDSVLKKGGGNLSDADRYYVNGLPKFTYGFNFNAKYKQFDGTVGFRGSVGGKLYNGTLTNLDNAGRLADGDNVYVDAISHGFSSAVISDYFLESSAFLRCDNISIGYNLTPNNSNGLKSLRVYVAANNLFLITKYKGTDPEAAPDGKNVNIENINIYPKNRIFTLGVNVGF